MSSRSFCFFTLFCEGAERIRRRIWLRPLRDSQRLPPRYLNRAAQENKKSITDAVYEIGGVEYFNIVTQNDEIGS